MYKHQKILVYFEQRPILDANKPTYIQRSIKVYLDSKQKVKTSAKAKANSEARLVCLILNFVMFYERYFFFVILYFKL